MAVLEVKNLAKSFRRNALSPRIQVLKNISFSVEPGTINGFLGGNGAGKTTTLKCIMQLLFPDSGEITFFNGPLTIEKKHRIGFLPENPHFYDYLTGYEFLVFYAQLSGLRSGVELTRRIDNLLEQVELSGARNKLLRSYSKGMLQKIGVLQAILHRPEILILDEPMSGLDPDGRVMVSDVIETSCREGAAVFFSSHLLHDVERLCQNLVVLKTGELFFEGKTSEFLANVSGEHEIRFISPEGPQAVVVADLEAVQVKIEELIAKKYRVTEVNSKKLSLEQAFVEKTLRPTK